MFIYGSYTNQKGDTVEVQILTGNDRSTTLEIGTKENGVYFNEDPIEIDDETNDVFDVFLSQSATITLLTTHYIAEFFQMSALNAKVNIRCAGKVVFAGYVEPQVYSQDFNEVYDELNLSCIDALSALQYSQYNNVTNSGNYAIAKTKADQIDLRTLLRNIIGSVGNGLDLSAAEAGACAVYYDGTVQTARGSKEIFSNTSINELLFYDDDADSVWTQEDVLKEVLRYFNLHIRQIGLDFFIFDWSTAKDNSLASAAWLNLNADIVSSASAVSASTIAINTSIVEDCGTQISIDETFNQIQLPCTRKEIDELAISPLDADSLVSPYSKRSLYCREMTAYPDDTDGYSYDQWDEMRPRLVSMENGEYQSNTEKCKIYDYYVQVFRNTNWTLRAYGAQYSDIAYDKDVYDVQLFSENEHSLLDHVNMSQSLQSEDSIVPAIVKVSKSSEKHMAGDGVKEFGDETTYLVIPVRGTALYNSDDTPGTSWNAMDARAMNLYNYGGLLRSATMSAGGSLSPADEDTTNYIVIEGKIFLQCVANSIYDSYYYGDNVESRKVASGYSLFTVVAASANNTPGDISDFDDRVNWRCWDKDSVCARLMKWYDTDGNEVSHASIRGIPRFIPKLGSQQRLQFTYNSDHDDWDTIDKVSVLDCRLKVGDKYCVETFEDYTDTTGHKRTRSIMRWLTEDQCPVYSVKDTDGVTRSYRKTTFSIGIDPEPGDLLIGTEFDIANTLLATDNIDAKGTAIPIKASDRLSGKVEFAILGPVNGTWNQVYRRHPTMFRHTTWTDHALSIMDSCSAIYISDFKIGVYSDNGQVTNGDDKDLVYISDEDAAYRNVQECDNMKINSALTSAECVELGVKNQVCLSNPTDETTGVPMTKVYNTHNAYTAKPEQLYVDAYYHECHTPKITLVQNLQDPKCERSMFDTYTHPALQGKAFYILGASRNLTDGSVKLKLREI